MTRLVVDGTDVAVLEMATTAATRGRGLLGRDGLAGALWFQPAKHIHTIGMRFDLDVAFVDRHGLVLHAQTVRRNRASRIVWRAAAVIEAEAGRFDGWGLRPGAVALPGDRYRRHDERP